MNLAEGRGFTFLDRPTVIRPPIYPAFLAAIYGAGGHDLRTVRLGQGVVDLATVGLVFLIGRRFFGDATAWLAALAAMCSPGLIFSSTQFLSETVYTALFTGAVFLLLSSQGTLDSRQAAAAGVLFGLGALTRAVGLPLLAVVLFGGMVRRGGHLKVAALTVLCSAAVIAPWTARNAFQLGMFVPVSNSRGGMTLWSGSYEPWGLEWRGWEQPPLDRVLRGLDPVADGERVDRVLIAEGLANIRENPAGYLRLCARKLWRLWHPPNAPIGNSAGANVVRAGLQVYHFAMLAFFAIGLVVGPIAKDVRLWIILLVAYWTAVHVITMATGRYLVPLLPIIYVVGASGAVALWRARDMRASRITIPLGSARR
jgi:4-amino-4-deoxy-L-arabinose transferase-like glycosyltransferase